MILYDEFFYLGLCVLFATALIFVIPPLWLQPENSKLKAPDNMLSFAAPWFYSCGLCIVIGAGSIYLYNKFGAATEIHEYYSIPQKMARRDLNQIRPLYAKLQREFIKNKLDLSIDLKNVDLILHFAMLHSNQQDGKLQDEVLQLLYAVLKAVPHEITALNLLGIHAYKHQQFAQAIAYWEQIMDQIAPENLNHVIVKTLRNKINATRFELKQFESRQTNNM